MSLKSKSIYCYQPELKIFQHLDIFTFMQDKKNPWSKLGGSFQNFHSLPLDLFNIKKYIYIDHQKFTTQYFTQSITFQA